MATPTNLYQYYTSKGQALPSVAARAPIYQQYGLGAANTYQGTAAQNTALLQKLLAGGAPAPAPAPAPAQAVAPTQTSRQQAATNFSTATTAFMDAQKAEEARLLAERSGFVNAQEPLVDLYKRLLGEAGVPQLQAQLEPIRQDTLTASTQLRNLPEDVAKYLRGEDASILRLVGTDKENKLRRAIADLATAQEFFAGQINSAQQGVGQQMSLYGEDFKRKLSNYETALSAFGERAAREASTFTKAKETELEAIFADISRAEDLSDQEAQRAFELLKQQNDYQNELKLIGARSAASKPTGSETQKAAQTDFIDRFNKTKDAAAQYGAKATENALYTFLKAGGAAEATKLGLNAEDFWNQWRSIAGVADPNIKLR